MPASYRYEVAAQGRAGCQNSACKKEGVKITKGELRFGTLVTIPDHGDSWKWKHWGCVTPVQIANIIAQFGGLDGLDLEQDLDILDGYEELPEWAQSKVKDALANGHVDDEDWKGEPHLNRPGMKGINKRTPKKQDGEDQSVDSAAEESPVKPKKGGRKKKAVASDDEEGEPAPKETATSKKRKATADVEDANETAPPKKRATKSKKAAVKDEDADADEPKPAPRRGGRARKAAIKDESDNEAPPAPPKRKSRAKKTKRKADSDSDANVAEEPTLPQTDGSAEPKAKKTSTKPAAKKASKRTAPVDENDDRQDESEAPVPKPATSRRGKKVKAEPSSVDVVADEPLPKPAKTKTTPKEEDDDVLDAGDKKKQARRGRGKKSNVVVPVPEDEQIDAAQPDVPEASITPTNVKNNADGDTMEVQAEEDASDKKDKKKGRKGRTARRSNSKVEEA